MSEKVLELENKELKKEIKNLKKENKILDKELKNKTANKELFKTRYFTTSKIALHFTHFLTLGIMAFVAITSYANLKDEPVVLASVLCTLATSCSAVLVITTKLYTDKAKADSDNMNKKERYQMAIQLAEKLTSLLADKKITESSIKILMTIISGVDSNDSNINTNSYSDNQNSGINNIGVLPNINNSLDSEGRG